MKPPTGPPKTRREKLALKWAEFLCRIFDHKWQSISDHRFAGSTGLGRGVRTGRVCVRCWDAEAHVYEGQYPVPR